MKLSTSLPLGLALFAATGLAQEPDCSCGYYDPVTLDLFTEKIIYYFNDTNTGIPTESFIVETFENKWERSWNGVFRNGANESQIGVAHLNATSSFPNANVSLNLYIDPATNNHLVQGASLKSIRRDILYGSFRTFMKPARNGTGGSAMSQVIRFNNTQMIYQNTMNTNNDSTAWLNTLVSGDFADRWTGVNFTDILEDPARWPNVDPWNFSEYRVDWTKESIKSYVGNNLYRTVPSSNVSREKYPSTPATFYLKHWSNGDPYNMDGPPKYHNAGQVGYTRVFFNSSSTTKEQREAFDARCHVAAACSMDDTTIPQGSSAIPEGADRTYKQVMKKGDLYWFAVWALVASVFITLICAINIIYQRWPTAESKKPKPIKHNFCRRLPRQIMSTEFISGAATLASAAMTPMTTRPSSINDGVTPKNPFEDMKFPFPGSSASLNQIRKKEERKERVAELVSQQHVVNRVEGQSSGAGMFMAEVAPSKTVYKPLAPRTRINYLAGMISIVTILVSLEHFFFTFLPAVVQPGAPHHYESELWAQNYIAPFVFNQIILGLFFITSTRFLISKFIKTGDLSNIAEKITGRTFRVMIPIAATVLLEYFIINCGGLQWLEYVPSVTWSTWPYTVGFDSFDRYISEVLELVYLIPNAAPQITFNYCTGVLWTIPVQLQNSWLTLLGVVLIREIKTPWKRAGFYAFCILQHWYAMSWGSFFWFGVMLTDYDITFKYKDALKKKPVALYGLLALATAGMLAGLMVDGIARWAGNPKFSLPAVERGIHPDVLTGRPIAQTGRKGFPQYTSPRLNGIVFSVCAQFIAENSMWVQNFLSAPIFLMIFPHIFTIYLVHGLVQWSIGSLVVTHLSAIGIPYWSNVLVTFVVCYAVLFAILPFMTPIVETLGKDATANVWSWAHKLPPQWRRSLFPFRDDLFFQERPDNVSRTNSFISGSSENEKDFEKGEKVARVSSVEAKKNYL